MTEHSSMSHGSSAKSAIRFAGADGINQVNPWDIIDPLVEVSGDQANYTHKLPELELPGHGDTLDDCGEDVPRFCDCCGDITKVGRTCKRSVCPRCWRSWARRRATTIGSKLEGLRRYTATRTGKSPKFHHLSLSPPDDFRTNREDALEAAFEVLKQVCRELGAETGVLFYHPYRAKAEGEKGDNRGVWKDILPRPEDDLDMADTREQMEDDSWHFHAVVMSHFVVGGEATKLIEERSGWLIKRITQTTNPNVSIYGQHDLARVLTYVLSHTGIDTSGERNRAAYRYFGQVANFTPTDGIEDEFDAVVRSIAPRTLGLKYDSLACLNTRARGVDGGTVDPRAAEASRTSSTSSSTSSSSSEPSTDSSATIVEYELEDACKGRLLDINKAPQYLEDSEWRAEAPFADELQTTWEEWRARLEDKPPPD